MGRLMIVFQTPASGSLMGPDFCDGSRDRTNSCGFMEHVSLFPSILQFDAKLDLAGSGKTVLR